jgi:serine protease Do
LEDLEEMAERLMSGSSKKRLTAKSLLAGTSILALAAGLALALNPTVNAATSGDTVIESAPPVQGGPNFADLVQRVKPAVVSVRVKITEGADTQGMYGESDPFNGENPFSGTPFEKFFKNFGKKHQKGQGDNNAPLAQAQGSGFFISSDGYIVTNNHVVDHAVNVEVVMDDEKTLPAKVIGTDSKTDLALIKVEGSDYPYVRLAASKPRIGEWVVAMGNPFGLGGTVTAGIVSAEGRDIGSGPYDDFIQIDAPVNKGNSGGPTFNLKGEVIGVNTAIFSPSGGSVGIAFDIPSTTVESVVPALKTSGKVDRAWLGVQIQPVTADIADSLGLKEAKGALIAQPQEGSPGAKAGLKAGDVITAVNSDEVIDARDLARKIGGMKPGTQVTLSVMHEGKAQSVPVTLGALDEGKIEKASTEDNTEKGDQIGKLGLQVMPASSVDGAGSEGIAVTNVDPNGKGAELGFQTGDVILKVGERSVTSADDLTKALADVKASGKKSALFLVKHNDEQRFVSVPVGLG